VESEVSRTCEVEVVPSVLRHRGSGVTSLTACRYYTEVRIGKVVGQYRAVDIRVPCNRIHVMRQVDIRSSVVLTRKSPVLVHL